MMKFVSTLTLFSAVVVCIGCQNSSQTMLKTQKEVYQQALEYNDLATATQAVYNILELSPQDSAYKDSLAQIYFSRGAHVQAVNVGDELLNNRPEDTTLLEMMAVSKEAIGQNEEALNHYGKLFKKQDDPYYQYQIASIQFKMKRYNECNSTLQTLLQRSDLKDKKVSISYKRGRQQQVPVEAAAYNIRGVLALQLKKNDVAKKSFKKATELHKDFVLAKNNLKAMQNAQNQAQTGQGQGGQQQRQRPPMGTGG
jgi:tetratricopeptide (TPR) repeat protein